MSQTSYGSDDWAQNTHLYAMTSFDEQWIAWDMCMEEPWMDASRVMDLHKNVIWMSFQDQLNFNCSPLLKHVLILSLDWIICGNKMGEHPRMTYHEMSIK